MFSACQRATVIPSDSQNAKKHKYFLRANLFVTIYIRPVLWESVHLPFNSSILAKSIYMNDRLREYTYLFYFRIFFIHCQPIDFALRLSSSFLTHFTLEYIYIKCLSGIFNAKHIVREYYRYNRIIHLSA